MMKASKRDEPGEATLVAQFNCVSIPPLSDRCVAYADHLGDRAPQEPEASKLRQEFGRCLMREPSFALVKRLRTHNMMVGDGVTVVEIRHLSIE
jgi:hypothetical protein